MEQPFKPSVVYHADWGSKDRKRWGANAVLGADDRYTAFAPERVANPGFLVERLRAQVGAAGCAFDGDLFLLFRPGNIVIAETYPAECCGWFSPSPLRSKSDQGERKKFGLALLHGGSDQDAHRAPVAHGRAAAGGRRRSSRRGGSALGASLPGLRCARTQRSFGPRA